VEYRESYDISNFLRLFGQSSEAARSGVKLDLGFELPKLEAGQFYYLYLPMAD
jgi:hypothetical protein